jgi:flagellar assembly protein FliH
MPLNRFTFEQDFSDEALDAERAELEAVEAEPPVPTFSEEEVAAARAEGRESGHAAGRAEAAAETDRLAALALEAIGNHIGTLGAVQEETLAITAREAIALAAGIARKAIPEIARHTAVPAIESFVTECLPRIFDEARVIIHVNAAVVGAVTDRIDGITASCGFSGAVVVLPDAALAAEDCRVEWGNGGAEKNAETMWREIDDATQQFLQATFPETPARAETTLASSDADDQHALC